MSKKAIVVASIALVFAIAAPSFAQGPFADVPIDHWAYDAVSQLQDHGIVIGYPDGTFSGKRALTRYEFAVALARAIPVILDMVPPGGTAGGNWATKEYVDNAIAGIKPGEGGTWASPADVDALKRSINEFRDELSGMGVDLDALKRDVASLEERVAALEEAAKRLRITTKLNFFAIGETDDTDAPGLSAVDKDGRPLANDNNLLKDISVVRDADVIFNYMNGDTRAKVVVNAGNYFNYLAGGPFAYPGPGLTTYTNTPRTGTDVNDQVNLFLAYGEVPLFGADVTVGRLPIQFTKWTLKKFDVDTYTENWKTDDGNYYVDGIKADWTWGSVDILAFAGKNNGNSGFYNLTSRPQSGPGGTLALLPFDLVAGAGNLSMPLQSAGARVGFDLGTVAVGLNYISVGEGLSPQIYDQADIWGGDLEFMLGSWKLAGAYTVSDSSAAAGSGAIKVDDDNAAWSAMLSGDVGSIGIEAGWKSIQENFAAPGAWDKIGRWQNPINIEGWNAGLNFGLGTTVDVGVYAAMYDGVGDTYIATDGAASAFPAYLDQDLELDHYRAMLNIKTGANNSIGLEGEWVRWDPNVAGAGTPAENYYTISYNHMIAENSKLRLLYQIIDYDPDGTAAAAAPYGADEYKGAVAVAQVSMDF